MDRIWSGFRFELRACAVKRASPCILSIPDRSLTTQVASGKRLWPTKPGRPNRFWATSVSNSRAELADSSADDRASEYQPLAICDDTFGNSRADSLLRIS